MLLTISHNSSSIFVTFNNIALRTCNKLTKAYREAEMLYSIKTKQNMFFLSKTLKAVKTQYNP